VREQLQLYSTARTSNRNLAAEGQAQEEEEEEEEEDGIHTCLLEGSIDL